MIHRLLRENISLPALYETEDIALQDKRVVLKFFSPYSNWTWYVVEGEKQENGDYLFFGIVDGFEREWGYFSLNELEGCTTKVGNGNLPLVELVELDLYFSPTSVKELGLA